jgi:hypothetical protein
MVTGQLDAAWLLISVPTNGSRPRKRLAGRHMGPLFMFHAQIAADAYGQFRKSKSSTAADLALTAAHDPC